MHTNGSSCDKRSLGQARMSRDTGGPLSPGSRVDDPEENSPAHLRLLGSGRLWWGRSQFAAGQAPGGVQGDAQGQRRPRRHAAWPHSYDEAGFIAGAAKLERLSHEPWQHFPQVRDDERSKANPDVWERQEQFQKMARDLEQATAALVQATTAPPLRRAELEPAVQAVEDSCEACHKAFRAY